MTKTIEVATIQGADGQLHQGEVVNREHESRFTGGDVVATIVTGGIWAITAGMSPEVKETTVKSGDSYFYGKELDSKIIEVSK